MATISPAPSESDTPRMTSRVPQPECTSCKRRMAGRSASVIGLQDLRVASYLLGRPFSQNVAVGHEVHAMGQCVHDRHVVLGDDQCPALPLHLATMADRLLGHLGA